MVEALTSARAEKGQGAPAASTGAVDKIDYIYQWIRNKRTNDGSFISFYGDDAATVNQKQSVGESGGTVTTGEMATGA